MNVRRSMVGMLALLAGLSTPLAGQSAWTIGLAATVGGGWQIEGADVGLVRRARLGPLRNVGLAARLGSFIDEGAILGGSQGFIAGLSISGRTGRTTIAEFGDQTNLTTVGLDLTLEATGYLGSRSPLPQGGRWMAVSLLPGLRFGNPGGVQWGLLVGPTAFLGHGAGLRGFLGIRFEAPLARRESHP